MQTFKKFIREFSSAPSYELGGSIEVKNFVDSPYPHLSSLSYELEAFAEEALGGLPYIIPPDQMVHGVAVLEAIIKSAESGKRVKPIF